MRLFEVSIDLDYYLGGYCHIFAMALNKAFSYPIHAIWDLSAYNDDGDDLPPCLVHMYCVKPSGELIDASGIINKEDILNGEYGDCNDPDEANYTYDDVIDLIHKGILAPPGPNELEQLSHYIEENKEKYGNM